MLGAQIGYFAVFLPLAILGVFGGYLITYRGLDRIERGKKALGISLLLAGAVLALFCAGILPGFGYWLARGRARFALELGRPIGRRSVQAQLLHS